MFPWLQRINPKIKTTLLMIPRPLLSYIYWVSVRIGEVFLNYNFLGSSQNLRHYVHLWITELLSPFENIHKISCSCGTDYFGETDRSIKTHLFGNLCYLRTGLVCKSVGADNK